MNQGEEPIWLQLNNFNQSRVTTSLMRNEKQNASQYKNLSKIGCTDKNVVIGEQLRQKRTAHADMKVIKKVMRNRNDKMSSRSKPQSNECKTCTAHTRSKPRHDCSQFNREKPKYHESHGHMWSDPRVHEQK